MSRVAPALRNLPDASQDLLHRAQELGHEARVQLGEEHELWILELLGSLDHHAVQQVYQALGKLRVQMVGNSA